MLVVALLLSGRYQQGPSETVRGERPGVESVDPLRGDAELVARFREISSPLLQLTLSQSPDERLTVCQAVAGKLDRAVDRQALLESAVSIPDRDLAELAVADRRGVGELLSACAQRDDSKTMAALKTLRAIDVLFDDRLEDLS